MFFEQRFQISKRNVARHGRDVARHVLARRALEKSVHQSTRLVVRLFAVRTFPQPRVAIAAGGHQADVFVRDEPQQRVRRGCVDRQHSLGDRCDAMSGQVGGGVSQPRRGLISGALRYFDDHDVLGLPQERQRILDGTTGLAHVFPGALPMMTRLAARASRATTSA